jgi:hypothetical protein
MIASDPTGNPPGDGVAGGLESGDRPDHFSTYAPRDLVRRLKVIAAIHDVPLWAVVTDAMRRYLETYERDHGRLPDAAGSRKRPNSRR